MTHVLHMCLNIPVGWNKRTNSGTRPSPNCVESIGTEKPAIRSLLKAFSNITHDMSVSEQHSG